MVRHLEELSTLKSVVSWESTGVSEEHIASIFRVDKISWVRNQHESTWQAACHVRSRWLGTGVFSIFRWIFNWSSATYIQWNITNSEFAILRTTFLRITTLMMRQNVVKEQYKRGTQTKISSFSKHGLSNITFLHFMTSTFTLRHEIWVSK
jgi:hypothetical protein